jgi:hypothetical protein
LKTLGDADFDSSTTAYHQKTSFPTLSEITTVNTAPIEPSKTEPATSCTECGHPAGNDLPCDIIQLSEIYTVSSPPGQFIEHAHLLRSKQQTTFPLDENMEAATTTSKRLVCDYQNVAAGDERNNKTEQRVPVHKSDHIADQSVKDVALLESAAHAQSPTKHVVKKKRDSSSIHRTTKRTRSGTENAGASLKYPERQGPNSDDQFAVSPNRVKRPRARFSAGSFRRAEPEFEETTLQKALDCFDDFQGKWMQVRELPVLKDMVTVQPLDQAMVAITEAEGLDQEDVFILRGLLQEVQTEMGSQLLTKGERKLFKELDGYIASLLNDNFWTDLVLDFPEHDNEDDGDYRLAKRRKNF